MADPQAEGEPARASGTSPGRTCGPLDRQAREPPSPIRPGVGTNRMVNEENGLERAAKGDDEAGEAGPLAACRAPDHRHRFDHLGRYRSRWSRAGEGPGRV